MVTSPGLAVPFYLHPVDGPQWWARLRAGDLGVEFAVVNVHNGVGDPEPAYAEVLAPGGATPMVGYVDTDYARGSPDRVLDQAATWADRYGIDQIFLDQVSVAEADRATVLSLIDRLTAQGVSRVIANPGRPAPEWLRRAAPIICEVELDWDTYRGLTWPSPPVRTDGSGHRHRSWHLLHSVPPEQQQVALDLAAARGADLVWVTSGEPPNPWRVIEPGWDRRPE